MNGWVCLLDKMKLDKKKKKKEQKKGSLRACLAVWLRVLFK